MWHDARSCYRRWASSKCQCQWQKLERSPQDNYGTGGGGCSLRTFVWSPSLEAFTKFHCMRRWWWNCRPSSLQGQHVASNNSHCLVVSITPCDLTFSLGPSQIIGQMANLEIAEMCARSGANCGSLFLDLRFRELVKVCPKTCVFA